MGAGRAVRAALGALLSQEPAKPVGTSIEQKPPLGRGVLRGSQTGHSVPSREGETSLLTGMWCARSCLLLRRGLVPPVPPIPPGLSPRAADDLGKASKSPVSSGDTQAALPARPCELFH